MINFVIKKSLYMMTNSRNVIDVPLMYNLKVKV